MHEAGTGLKGHAAAAICGSKGTGKSSFGRLLLNTLLNTCREVAWLDTDCGQPEFTVPGLHTSHPQDTPVATCLGCQPLPHVTLFITRG